MKHTLIQGMLTVLMEGRVDSANAAQVEAEITQLREMPHSALTLDCSGLQYISSAGLRVVLRLIKKETDLMMTNVSSEVYDALEVTGFTELLKVKKAYRQCSVDGCEIIGQGANGVVYRIDRDTVVKVYKRLDCLDDVHRERELARKAFVLGVPTAIPYDVVQVGEQYGSVFELIDAHSFSKLIAEDAEHLETYAGMFADVMRTMHTTHVKPGEMPSGKALCLSWAEQAKPCLPEDVAEQVFALLEALPETDTIIHGDYHTNNIVMQRGEAILLDMDTLSMGHPVLELYMAYRALVGLGEKDPTMVERFLGVPYEVTCRFWRKALEKYLDTTDEARLRDVENKARLLCYLRLIRRTAKRGLQNTPEGRENIEWSLKRLRELLPQVDTLTF